MTVLGQCPGDVDALAACLDQSLAGALHLADLPARRPRPCGQGSGWGSPSRPDRRAATRRRERRRIPPGTRTTGHARITSGPASSISRAMSASTSLSVMIVSTSDRSATWANSSRPNLVWSASTTVRRAERDQRALDRGLREVRSGQPATGADPVRAGERDVGEDPGQVALRPAADRGQRAGPHLPADQVQGDVRPLGQQRGDRQRVRDHGETAGRCGSISANRTVVVPASMMIEPPSGSWSSAALAMRSFCSALTPNRSSTAELHAQPLDRDRAAVHPAQHAPPLEAGEIPADGLRRDVEDVRQGVDIDATVGAGAAENGLLPFGCVHVDSVVVARL